MKDLLAFSPKVEAALATGKPVVALESTIITHGMPYPQNLDVARKVEATVRDGGAVPATIAVIKGQIHIGLDDATLEALAATPGDQVMKLSRADLAACCAMGRTGATTVAATMRRARWRATASAALPWRIWRRIRPTRIMFWRYPRPCRVLF